MAHINLLPWREELRAAKQQQFITAMVVALISAAVIWFAGENYVGSLIDNQKRRNDYLNQEIAKVDKQIKEIEELEKKRTQLEERIRVITELQQSRPSIVHLFDEIVQTLPDGVSLDSIAQSGPRITFRGVAQSNARVSAYMRNIESSAWIGDPALSVITNLPGAEKQFTLSAKQVVPKQDENK